MTRRRCGLLVAVTVVASCALEEAQENGELGDALPCVPREQQCRGDDREAVCARDGLQWEIRPCGDGQSCRGTSRAGRCQDRPVGARELEDNFDATVQILRADSNKCSAFLVNDDTVVTNEHCCRAEAEMCVGSRVLVQYRGREQLQSAPEIVIEANLGSFPELDLAILRASGSPGATLGHVAVARGRRFLGSPVYVMGHPQGRPLEASLGRIYAYEQSVEYEYTSGRKRKVDQFVYGARAEPGSSGSPVFSATTHVLVGLHHSGGLRPDSFDLAPSDVDEFGSLLGATDSEAIASALEAVGVVFEEEIQE